MSKKVNKSLLLLILISLGCFIVFCALFAVLIPIKGGSFQDILDVLKEGFSKENVLQLFIPTKGGIQIIYSVITYLFALYGLFVIIFGLILTIKSKKPFIIVCILIGLLCLLPAYAFMVGAKPIEDTPNQYRTFIFDTVFNGKFDSNDNKVLILVLTWVYLVFIVFAISLPISTFIHAILCESKKNVNNIVKESVEEDDSDEETILKEFAALDAEPVIDEEKIEEKESEETVMEDKIEPTEFKQKPEEEFKEDEIAYSESELRSLIREIIKDTVRDELEKRNALNEIQNPIQQAQGLNNGGPIIVQYFNGNGQNNDKQGQPTNPPYPPYGYPYPFPPYPYPYPYQYPQQNEGGNNNQINNNPQNINQPQNAPQPEAKIEEEIIEEKAVKEAKEVEPIPVVKEEKKADKKPSKENKVAEPALEDSDDDEGGKGKIVRVPFYERILTVDEELQSLYSELKNELLSYGLKSRVAANGDTFRLHRKTYCRISVAGKSLKLHLALNPDDYKDSKMPFSDAGDKATYAEIPLVFKVKSGLSLRRAKGLIADACAKDNLIQEDILSVNWVKEIKANMD